MLRNTVSGDPITVSVLGPPPRELCLPIWACALRLNFRLFLAGYGPGYIPGTFPKIARAPASMARIVSKCNAFLIFLKVHKKNIIFSFN